MQKVLQVKLVDIDQNSLNLNMAEQITLPFLTDLPGSSRLKLFNKLTGNDLLDKVQGNISKEILNINKEIKNVKDIIETNKPKVESLSTELDRRQKLSFSLEASRLKIEKRLEVYQKLKSIQEKLAYNLSAYNDTLADLICIKEAEPGAVESLKSQIQTLNSLYSIKASLGVVELELTQTKGLLETIPVAQIKGEDLRLLIKRVESLNRYQKLFSDTKEGLEAVLGQLNSIKVTELDGTALRGKIDLIKRLNTLSKALSDNGAVIKQSFGEWNSLQMTYSAQRSRI